MRVRTAALATFLAASVAFSGAVALAHHGGAIEWGEETHGPITATATEFAFRFPHVQVEADVTNPDGAIAHWTFVTRWTPTILRNHGWSRDSIEAGDTLTITYNPHVRFPTVASIVSIAVNGEMLEIDFAE